MMKRRFSLGHVAGLELTAGPSALLGSLGIAALVFALARRRGRPLAQLAPLALLAPVIHWLSDLAHHLGHATAARQSGYPMRGVHFWGVLGTSLYPRDEPPLPAEIHIQRALGGPVASTLLALTAAGLGVAWRRPGLGRDLALLAFVDNLILGPGALLPLPMIDGGTLRRWLPRRGLPAGEVEA
jgi:Zn-dependent protease